MILINREKVNERLSAFKNIDVYLHMEMTMGGIYIS